MVCYFFCVQGFWRSKAGSLAAPANLGVSIHILGVSWDFVTFQMLMKIIQCYSVHVICSKWHFRPWSRTRFQAPFLNNRLRIAQNGSKPISQIAPFTLNHWHFLEFLNECGEILSRTDMVLPDLVLAVFWVVNQISAFWDGSYPSVHI